MSLIQFSLIRQVTHEYLDIKKDRILFYKLLHELNMNVCFEIFFFCSIEVTNFSSKLYLISTNLTRLKCITLQQKVPMASNIIAFEEMSSLYLLYVQILDYITIVSPHERKPVQNT